MCFFLPTSYDQPAPTRSLQLPAGESWSHFGEFPCWDANSVVFFLIVLFFAKAECPLLHSVTSRLKMTAWISIWRSPPWRPQSISHGNVGFIHSFAHLFIQQTFAAHIDYPMLSSVCQCSQRWPKPWFPRVKRIMAEVDEGETCQMMSEGISEKMRLELKFGETARKKWRKMEACTSRVTAG